MKPIFKNKEKAIEARTCFDCEKKITIEEEEIKDGALLVYENTEGEYFAFKCDDCYKKDPGLSGYKQCEVYSRIVGYLRPVNQWNQGKAQEYTERKEYTLQE